jgi:hypothetical protein
MARRDRWIGLFVVAACLLPACTEASGEGGDTEPVATVEAVPGSDLSRVVLSSAGADRLGIETAPVEAIADGGLVVPYAAILYDPTGRTWVYTNPEPLTYVRAEVSVTAIRHGDAIATSGPPAGTEVVTTGASELLGTEYEVGEE